ELRRPPGAGTYRAFGLCRGEADHVDHAVKVAEGGNLRLEGREVVTVADDLLHRPFDAQRRLPAVIEYDDVAAFEQNARDRCADKAGATDQENTHGSLQSWGRQPLDEAGMAVAVGKNCLLHDTTTVDAQAQHILLGRAAAQVIADAIERALRRVADKECFEGG